jgi:transposase
MVLHAGIKASTPENIFYRNPPAEAGPVRRRALSDRSRDRPITTRTRMLYVSRGSVCSLPQPASAADLALARRMGEPPAGLPVAGSPVLWDRPNADGCRHAAKLMKRLRIQYGKRAGIEGTISQGVRAFDLRRSRYVGKVKTHLQHLLIAAAMDLVHIYYWLVGEPRAQTRQTSFTALMKTKPA